MAEEVKALPQTKAHPMETCSLLSHITVSWISPLLKLGSKQPLALSDVDELPQWMRAAPLGEKFAVAYERAVKRSRVLKALFSSFGKHYVRGLCMAPLYIGCNALSPLALKALIGFLNNEAKYVDDAFCGIESGWILAVILSLCSLGVTVGMNGMFLNNTIFGSNCRTAIMQALYCKVLGLSEAALQQSSLGQIVTLTSADLERIFLGTLQSVLLVTSPILLGIGILLLVLEVGVLPTIAGFAFVTLMLPLNVLAASSMGKRKRRMLELTDARVRFMTEILRGIRIVKFHSWEAHIENHIQSLRVKETRENTKVVMLMAFSASSGFTIPALIPFVMFATEIAMGNKLTVEKVFTVLAVMNVMRLPMMMLPRAINGITQALVSVRRIERFLSIPERVVGWDGMNDSKDAILADGLDVDLRMVSCSWGGKAEREAMQDLAKTAPKGKGKGKGPGAAVDNLKNESKGKGKGKAPESNRSDETIDKGDPDITLAFREVSISVPHQQKVAVIGRVASGKSSLLYGMLGELEIKQGTIARSAPIVPYCSQSSWIQSATLKENILFGLAEDARLYQHAIEAAQLKPDLLTLPNGDDTFIGENGINLSGGQRARTALARAFYASLKSESPLVLLDDPIAAVDAFVAHALFHKGFLGLLKEKTVVLTLNAHLDLLSSFDRVIALEDGRVVVDGSLDEVMKVMPWVRDAVGTTGTRDSIKAHTQDEARALVEKVPVEKASVDSQKSVDGGRSSLVSIVEKAEKLARPLYEPEDRVMGRVQLHNYVEWARCAISDSNGSKLAGWLLLFMIVVVFEAAQALRMSLDVWCARWAEIDEDDSFALAIYGALAGSFVISVILRGFVFFLVAMRSCRSLHLMVLRRVLKAPVNMFFDVTPSGRILNRFSSDLEKVDDQLPEKLFMFLQLVVQVASSVAIVVSSSPFIIIGIPFIGFLFFKIVSFYQKSARELKRLDAISRSSMLQHFSESIKGLATIRAYHAVPRFVQKYNNLVNAHAKVFLHFWIASRWLAMRVDVCAASLQALVALVSVAWKDNVDPVMVGVALVWGFQLSGMLQFCVRSFAEVENTMTGVERLIAYKHVPQEADYILEPRPEKGWPGGEIELRNVSARYRPDLPLVLKNVSLHIFPGERVGVCGRTGSGKSTLGLVLFRMVEAESGQVLIDRRDTRTVGLQDLRQRLAMIPQDPVLFRLSVRQNLDPFEIYSDEQLWKALELVSLDSAIRALAGDLSFLCSEGGTNFSQGQMQLMCIARTLLHVPGIVMMDEATANIDTLSDEIIQRTIRSHLTNVTVLTIAHRLSTIADSTKIAVFDKGELCEYGSPEELVNRGGALAAFFREAGIEPPASKERVEFMVSI